MAVLQSMSSGGSNIRAAAAIAAATRRTFSNVKLSAMTSRHPSVPKAISPDMRRDCMRLLRGEAAAQFVLRRDDGDAVLIADDGDAIVVIPSVARDLVGPRAANHRARSLAHARDDRRRLRVAFMHDIHFRRVC